MQQLLKARDRSSFLFSKVLSNCLPVSGNSDKSLCVKKKSVSLEFADNPLARRFKPYLLILLWLMYICYIFRFVFKVFDIGSIWLSFNSFLSKFKFFRGKILNRLVRVVPLILLLSISMFLNWSLFCKTAIKLSPPSLSISLLDSYNSSIVAHLLINWQISLQPLEVMPLLDKLRVCMLCLFLLDSALIIISIPSSVILLPVRLSSLIVLLRVKQSSNCLIP